MSAPSSPAHVVAPHRRRVARLGAILAVLTAGAIAVATLTPGRVSPYDEPIGHWCLICGRLGGADVFQNIVLFFPLGAGLALAGGGGEPRPRRVALLALAFSTAVELAQAFVVPGRFATISDVVTNTTGGWLGAAVVATWRLWLAPSPRVARRLAACAATLWLFVLSVTAWALGHSPAPGPVPPTPGDLRWTPEMGWYAGLVHEGWVDSLRVPHRGSGAVIIGTATGTAVSGGVVESGSDGRPFIVPMLYVHGARATPPELVIGQVDHAAVVGVHLRAARLRLRQPILSIPGVFPPTRGPSDGPLREISGGYDGGSLQLRVRAEGGEPARARTLPLTVDLGWALIFPIARADRAGAGLMTALWLAGLLVPLGYWLAAALGEARHGRGVGAAVAVGATMLVVGLAVVPAIGGRPATPFATWVVAVAWTAGGFATGVVARARWGRARHPFHRAAPATTFPA